MKLIGENTYDLTHFCLFAGMGGLSLGLNRGHARMGRIRTRPRCLGGVDVWPVAARNFSEITGSRGTVMDLFEAEDYRIFHGKPIKNDKGEVIGWKKAEIPHGWREATPADIRAAAGGECPDILATSPPCKGFSGLLNPKDAAGPKYQALNNLVIRGLQLSLEAFADDPPAFILLENVPRIQQRGRQLLDDVEAQLRHHGYAVNETTHDCGEIGGLSQRRPRFLLVARHTRKVRPFIYVPPKSRVKSIGEALQQLPLPEAPHAGPMHRLPRLQWLTWLRLALIKAGKDWRSLQDLAVVDGNLRDVGIMPLNADWHGGVMGVKRWGDTAATVTGHPSVTCGAHAVADPRWPEGQFSTFQPYSVVPWDKPAGTVTSQAAPGSGPYTVADPRLNCDADDLQGRRHNNVYRLVRWDAACNAVTAGTGPSAGGLNVADPRIPAGYGQHSGKLAVQDWEGPGRTVTGTDRVGSGAQCVADPRLREGAIGSYANKMRMQPWDGPARTITCDTDVQAGAQCIADPRLTWSKSPDGDWKNGGHYGVQDWDKPAAAVVAHAKHDNGFFSVADPRLLPALDDRPDPVPLIMSLDDTWHRPLTTLELGHLQGYPMFGLDGRPLALEGGSDQVLRELIGNSVPPPAAEAIARTVGEAMLADVLGETFILSPRDIWVQPFQVAVSLPHYGEA